MSRPHAAFTALLGAWATLALVSCGDGSAAPGGDFEVLRSSVARDRSPNPAPGDLAEQVAGNTELALDLYRYLAARSSDNLFCSPHSISTALAMTWAGAKGDTEQEMADTLHFVLPQERFHPVFNTLDLELESRAQGGEGSDGQGFRLHVVNSNWLQRDYPVLETFLDVLAQSYGAAVHLVDFIADADGARQTINAWVEDQTEDRIRELLPAGAVNILTRLVLVNAVTFNAAWAQPFAPEDTAQETFYRLDGSGVTVAMMHKQEMLPYAEGDGWQAIELPYEGEDLTMLILVPDRDGFEGFQGDLDAARLAGIVDVLDEREVVLSLPRWTLSGATFSLKEALSDLGMPTAFSESLADFSGITGERGLFIQDVLHQAFVKVDEAGTEAAAATAVPIGLRAAPGGPAVVQVNRPFVYLIRDRPTGVVLFLGRTVDPTVE